MNVNPPASIPEITGADTQSQLSVTLRAPFHGYISIVFRAETAARTSDRARQNETPSKGT
jgi:hypothetical protein